MKAILINPFEQSVTEVDYSGDYNQIYEFIEAQMFDVARISHDDGIFVDDEGLLNSPTHFFEHSDYHSPLAGKGLIVGCNSEGESVDCKTTVDEVKAKVTFSNIFQMRARYAEDRPSTTFASARESAIDEQADMDRDPWEAA